MSGALLILHYSMTSEKNADAMMDLQSASLCLEVPHIMQADTWDCGIACVKMVLSCIHPDGSEEGPADFNVVCERLGFGESIWTIDLAHLMLQYGVKHNLYTITLGVDPTYEGVTFYNQEMKAEFTTEQERVNQLFASATSKGIQVEKRSVSNGEIVGHLSCHNPAIILVDDAILHCESCEQNRSGQGCSISCFRSREDDGYVGHFIVLCGVDVAKKMFLYRNPGIQEDLCCCSFDNLDEARRSHGTDEDILFVYR